MYTLYSSPGSAGMMVHQLLIELGVPYEQRLLDLKAGEHRTPEYLALNPNGVVPTMLVDGEPCAESAALMLVLAERHPDAGFAPAPGSATRAEFLYWMVFLSNTLQASYRLWFYPGDLGPDAHESIKTGARERIEAIWTRIDARFADGRPYMLGDAISVLDFYVLMLMRWSRNMPKPATTWPHLAQFAARMKARPSWKKMYELDGLTEWA
jgi:glutathione S-transferase